MIECYQIPVVFEVSIDATCTASISAETKQIKNHEGIVSITMAVAVQYSDAARLSD